MAGTDATRTPSEIDGPAFILVRPQLGENIGAVCRAMWNFGLTDLRLVAPRDGWPNPAAVATASGATRVLDGARVFDTVADAAADLARLYASTARPRELTKRVLSPEGASAEMAAAVRLGERVGVLFGPERAGLENDDVSAANAIITIPANPVFSSLNLGQSAVVMGYEWRRRATPGPYETRHLGKSTLATRAEVDRLYAHLESALDAVTYFWPEHKRPAMAASLRNCLARAPLTEQDVRMLRGVVRVLSDPSRRADGAADPQGAHGAARPSDPEDDPAREI